MDWCRLSTLYYLDDALLRAGEAAEVLFLRCIAYSGAKETRGRIPRHALPMLTPTRTKARLDALLRERLLVADGDDVVIRSWERWQEQLDAEADRRRRDRDRKARARAEARGQCAAESADTSEDASADKPRTVRTETARKEVEEERSSTEERRTRRASRIPDDFTISDEMRSWLSDERLPVPWAEKITAEFVDYWRAKPANATKLDWIGTWRNWLRREARDHPPAVARPLHAVTSGGVPWPKG